MNNHDWPSFFDQKKDTKTKEIRWFKILLYIIIPIVLFSGLGFLSAFLVDAPYILGRATATVAGISGLLGGGYGYFKMSGQKKGTLVFKTALWLLLVVFVGAIITDNIKYLASPLKPILLPLTKKESQPPVMITGEKIGSGKLF